MSTDTQNSAPASVKPVAYKVPGGTARAMDIERYQDAASFGGDKDRLHAAAQENEWKPLYAAPVAAQPDQVLTQQTLDDVKAGIPARDAEIEALRKEIESLKTIPAMPYSLNLDPAGIRALTADAISGALAFGYQGVNPPPDSDHWLASFWEIGRESVAKAQQPVSGADQFRDAAQMIEPSGNSGEFKKLAIQKLTEAYKAGMQGKDYSMPRASELLSHAALAQQDVYKTAFKEWNTKTEFVQKWMNTGKLSARYLGWHRADVMRDLLEKQDADKVDAEPDMFWNADNPEQCQDSIHNLLVEVQCDRTLRVGDIVEIQQAVSLPNISVRITAVDTDDDDGDLQYEIVNDAAIDAARKENGNG